jgi:hypothetical protein
MAELIIQHTAVSSTGSAVQQSPGNAQVVQTSTNATSAQDNDQQLRRLFDQSKGQDDGYVA